MLDRGLYLAILAISFAVILLEIAYTRIFSFKIYYYFTYLIIGISMLGLGAGGVLVSILPRLREADLASLLARAGAAAGVAIALGYGVIASVTLHGTELTASPLQLLKLIGILGLLFLPFLIAGIAIAALLAARLAEVHRLYATDLLGAALGCVLAVPLLQSIGPPGCVLLGALIFSLGTLPLARLAGRRTLAPAAALTVGLALLLHFRDSLPEPALDPIKGLGEYQEADLTVFSSWSPVFRIDVAKHPFKPEQTHVIFHDGLVGSTLQRFDGDLSKLAHFRQDPRSTPFSVSGPAPRVLIIGSAGGHEVLASLYFDAAHVTGVELNPVTVELLHGEFAEFTGRLHEHDRVTLVQAEGRSFLKRSRDKYDLIWLVAPDSYAAMNAATSGAFVLSESYLYTVEMIQQILDHLTPGGILCAQFGELDYSRKPNRTARYVSTAREAFRERGTPDFARHVMVSTSSELPPFALSTVLLGRSPFTRDQVQRFLDNAGQVKHGRARYAPGQALDSGAVNRLIRLPQPLLQSWYEAHPYDLRPVRDDSPFFWHFARFGDALRSERSSGPLIDWEDAIGERVLVQLLIVMVVFSALSLLLPMLTIRGVWSDVPHKTLAGIYFASLGMGFMCFEICLIQMLTLFLGYPTYSLSVTLFGLLVFSGLGSLASGRYLAHVPRALGLLLATLGSLVLFYTLGMPLVMDRFVGAPLLARAALAVSMIAPLGFSLGAFMPLGLATVGALSRHTREYVAWAWGVNGFFSVIMAILATILAMELGFRGVLLIALVFYGAAAGALLVLARRAEQNHE